MAAKLIDLSFTLNGRKVKVQIAPDTMLFALLREQGCASVRCACETTNCGLCTVWLDGDPVLSCSVPAARVEGRSITTLEGLKAESEALARAMAAEGAEQCGFCAPGLIMNVLALARAAKEDPSLVATREELSRQLAGNLCRCSGYESQLRAIVRFLNESGVQVGFELPELPVNDTSCDGVEYKQITHKQPKKDSKALLEGRPVYTGDMVPAGALIVKLKRSPYARAKIRSIDTSRALKVPGVVGVYTYEDVPQRRFTIAGQSYPQPSPYDRLILENLVRYQNEEVAIVAAETEEAADKALKLIKVDYEVLEPLLDFTQALDNDIVVHPEGDVTFMFPQGGDVPRNLVCSGVNDFGDLDEAFAQSDIVFERTYTSQATQTAPMETFRAFATTDAFGRISVTTSTQVPFHVRRMIAQSLDIPQSQVQVIKPRIGGGFGSKQSGCCEIFVAFVTQQTGRPSYCCYTREETITAGNSRHQMQMTVKMGAMNDGTITAIDLHTLSNAGAYGEHTTTTIGLSGHKSLPIYNHVKASRFRWDAVYTNTNRGGAYRGYGATQGQFAVESAVNELADMLHMDPADLRLKNMVHEGEIMPQYYNEKLNACALDRCLLRAMDMIGWRDKPLAVDLGDRVRALGCALTMQGSGISNVDIAGIDMRLEEDGFITISTGATDNGMGVDTILAQIAAEELGVESSLIVVRGVDTDVSPFDAGSYASSGTYVTGLAAKNAATELREKICAKAAQMWDVDACDVVFDGQYVRLSDGRAARERGRYLTLRDFANLCVKNIEGGDALTSHASACLPVSPPPFMAGIAEVEVDKATGKVTVVDYAAAVDCGTVINEALARVQAEGGIAQGIGHALYEIVEHDDRGRLRTGNFMSYKLPTRLDIGSIRVAFEPSYEPTGPFGAKSIGEVVINTPLAAVASAVAHATGHQVRSLPITPEKALLGE